MRGAITAAGRLPDRWGFAYDPAVHRLGKGGCMHVARSALSLFFSAAVALGLTAGHTPSGADELSTASGPELFRAPRGALGSRSLPPGFTDTIAFSGLSLPTVVQFAADGRVFIGEKSGLIEVFDSLSDTQPTVFADLRTNVYDYGDRGLLGMALDPHFPAKPFVYVL